MKPTEYIDKTLNETPSAQTHQITEGDFINFSTSGRVVDVVWGEKGISGYSVEVGGGSGDIIFVNASDVIEQKNEADESNDYAVFEWIAEYKDGSKARNPSYSCVKISDAKIFILNHPGAKKISSAMTAVECQKYIQDVYRDPVRYM